MRFKIGKLYHIISFRFILLQFDVSHDISIEKVQKKWILELLTPHVKYPFKFPHGVLIWKAATTYPSGHVYQISASYYYSFMPKSVWQTDILLLKACDRQTFIFNIPRWFKYLNINYIVLRLFDRARTSHGPEWYTWWVVLKHL